MRLVRNWKSLLKTKENEENEQKCLLADFLEHPL